MKIASILFAVAGSGCLVFAYWGLETRHGRAAFDEMAGMIPFFAGIAGAAALAVAAVLTILRMWGRGG